MTVKMRAKLKVESVTQHETAETLKFRAVSKSSAYPDDGSDEDNTFSRFTPSAELSMLINNPALQGQFKPGDTFYLDFTPAD